MKKVHKGAEDFNEVSKRFVSLESERNCLTLAAGFALTAVENNVAFALTKPMNNVTLKAHNIVRGEVGTMFERKAYEKLGSWKKGGAKKALCIIGARQIGKTTVVRQFGTAEYECFAEINFITDEGAADIFSGALDADTIITNLTAYLRKPLVIGKTLILFDEIQECPNARTAIKFLVEDGRFHYIETGSLLGVRFNEVRSYPVGFEEIYRMYPMDFEEYVIANGVQRSVIDKLRSCYENKSPISDSVHTTMTKLFNSYIVVGGMPQVVDTYTRTHDIGSVIANQKDIIELYRLDISKYAIGNDRIKIQAIFDSIPSQLNDKNRRFILTSLDEHGRQNRYENSFNWLSDAGVAMPCYNVTEPQPPLMLNEKHSLMKLFMGDTGLLCAACMNNVQFDILQGRLEINLGSILENMIAQSLKSNGFRLTYFDSKKYGEIDFVIQNGMKTDLVEVKSGNDYQKHTAMNKISAVTEWCFDKRYVFCKRNVQIAGDVTYLPWYLVMFYKPDGIPSDMKYEVDLSGLK